MSEQEFDNEAAVIDAPPEKAEKPKRTRKPKAEKAAAAEPVAEAPVEVSSHGDGDATAAAVEEPPAEAPEAGPQR